MGLSVVGVDGCRGGWMACRYDLDRRQFSFEVYARFEDLLEEYSDSRLIAVDMPIGLRDDGAPRKCDFEARKMLSPTRGSSVFPAPSRPLLSCATHVEATSRSRDLSGKGVSIQAFGIFKKVAEVDRLMTPALQKRVFEVHPELCFVALSGAPVIPQKSTVSGYDERKRLLESATGCTVPERGDWRSVKKSRPAGQSVAPDDVLDAAVASVTAHRVLAGDADRVPFDAPEFDSKGLRMEIAF